MPRKPRLFLPESTCHGYCRVARGENVSDIEDFVSHFEAHSGHTLVEHSLPRRTKALIRGRIEMTLLAVGRYGFQAGVLAKLMHKNRSSLTRWLNLGLRMQRDDQVFRNRIDVLDQRIAALGINNASMRNVAQ